MNKSIELDNNVTLTCVQRMCIMSELQACIKAYTQEYNTLKIEVDKLEIECNLRQENRDTMKQMCEEMEKKVKRNKFIEIMTCNIELAEELEEVIKKQSFEREEQAKKREKEYRAIYEESMRIFESTPFVTELKELKRRNDIRRFEIRWKTQKVDDLKKVYANMEEMQKKMEQKAIIRIAEIMVKYYNKHKQQNEKNDKRNLKITSQIRNTTTVKSSTKINPGPVDLPRRNYTTLQKMEKPKFDMMQFQLPNFLMSRNDFNLNTNPLKKSNFTGFEYKQTPEKCLVNQQRQELTRPVETQECAKRPKLSSPPKNIQFLEQNMETEKEQIIFLSQPSRYSSQNDDITLLSQESKISCSNKNKANVVPLYKQKEEIDLNPSKKLIKIHAIETIKPANINLKRVQDKNESQTTEIQKQNPFEVLKQRPSLDQKLENRLPSSVTGMFDFQSSKRATKMDEMFDSQKLMPQRNLRPPEKQNIGDYSKLFPQFDAPPHTPVPAENPVKAIYFPPIPEPSKQLETKSPYFAHQSSSQEDRNSMNTTAEESDRNLNVSSDRNMNVSSDRNMNISSDLPLSGNSGAVLMNPTTEKTMEADNEGYNMDKYYKENPDPYFEHFGGYTSPPDLEQGGNLNTSAPPTLPLLEQEVSQKLSQSSTNFFGSKPQESTGNNFFKFQQSSNKSSGFFSMF